jgi:hypothetical protein
MGGDNVERLWYGLCLIKAVVTLFVISVFVLLCKRLLRCIPWNRTKPCSTKHPMVHSLGTVQPPRNFGVSESNAVDHSPNQRKERIENCHGHQHSTSRAT